MIIDKDGEIVDLFAPAPLKLAFEEIITKVVES